MNKKEASIVASHHGISVPKEYVLPVGKVLASQDIWFGFPMIVKLNTWGSSYYTYKVETQQDLDLKIQHIREHIQDDILIQEYILGDEYSISLVQWEVLEAIMFVEKKNPNDFFDYESKYETETGMREAFPKLEAELQYRLLSFAENVKNIFWLTKGYTRIDVIVREGVPYFLEVNTIPGSTEVSILPKAWQLTGRSLEDFVETILA